MRKLLAPNQPNDDQNYTYGPNNLANEYDHCTKWGDEWDQEANCCANEPDCESG
jgi:hypothetical protein